MQIKEQRKKAGLTQSKLAELLAVSQSTVCGWETGAATVPVAQLLAMADLFCCTTDTLLGRQTASA
ncbi:helix-turn-helix transcriptional regulator [Oscillibacter sp.]|uniref:helix-turn-helix domain-containing protein n=1 Tax=Oscillibacter sp. TaxID=1945593 RepID=UPI00289A9D6D|nr:helix-turn-helix transcriptional regulator [Oscillibacter sp.]